MTIKIYNTLTRRVEEFKPLQKNILKMYSCGVTTYDEIHLGHARQGIVFDIIRNYFEFLGYKVNYVRNYTDIDDKIIKRANERKENWLKISNFFVIESKKDLLSLKVKPATHEPRVTQHIEDIVQYIKVLIEKGYAYESKGDVLFDITKDKEYGKLSNRNVDDLISEKEVTRKRNPQDFSLWKKAKKDEPFWKSPWGDGRPGWHIECSVLSNLYLGNKLDIHGGGIDLLFPHHENEIAQSEAYSQEKFANFWVHNGLVKINGQKMSKSSGNFLTVKDTLVKQTADEVRYVVLIHNYSSQIDFSKELFIEARKRVHYYYKTLEKINQFRNKKQLDFEKCPEFIKTMKDNYIKSMNNDFNTARVISELAEIFNRLNELIEDKSIIMESKINIYNCFYHEFNEIIQVLKIFNEDPKEYLTKLQDIFFRDNDISEDMILDKIEKRNLARKNNDYAKADQVRKELQEMKINVKDGGTGQTDWELIFD